jgi:hypothetical protein
MTFMHFSVQCATHSQVWCKHLTFHAQCCPFYWLLLLDHNQKKGDQQPSASHTESDPESSVYNGTSLQILGTVGCPCPGPSVKEGGSGKSEAVKGTSKKRDFVPICWDQQSIYNKVSPANLHPNTIPLGKTKENKTNTEKLVKSFSLYRETKFCQAGIIWGVIQPIVELISGLRPGPHFDSLFLTWSSAHMTHRT